MSRHKKNRKCKIKYTATCLRNFEILIVDVSVRKPEATKKEKSKKKSKSFCLGWQFCPLQGHVIVFEIKGHLLWFAIFEFIIV